MDYFTRLAQQALDLAAGPAVQPRLPARFEPSGIAAPAVALYEQDVSLDRGAPPLPLEQRPSPAERQWAASEPSSTLLAPSPTLVTPLSRPSAHEHAGEQPAALERRRVEAPAAPVSGSPVASPAASAPPIASASGNTSRPAPVVPAPAAPRSPAGRAAIVPALSPQPVVARERTEAQAMPVIRVSIGRVDVRAVTRPAAAAPRSSPAPQPAAASLEAYLRANKGDRSR
jgi:hypothetical protein